MDPEVSVRTEERGKVSLQLQPLDTQRVDRNPQILTHKLIISQGNVNFPLQFLISLALRNAVLFSLIEADMGKGELSSSYERDQDLPAEVIDVSVFFFEVPDCLEPEVQE